MLLYIDPGTGSMLFTVLIGIIGAAYYSLRMLFIKFRFRLSGGNTDIQQEQTHPFVIFSDNKRYWSIFEPICREMNQRNQKILYITASPDDPALHCEYPNVTAECIENNNILFARLNFLNAYILLSTTPGLDVYQWKRSKNVQYYVHIPHAAGEVVMYRMFGIDYYDAILLSGDYQINNIRELEQLRGLPEKETIKVGIPYMDEMAKKLKSSPTPPSHPRTVLLAPSWGPSSIFAILGEKIIDVLLETGYHIIIRPHPQSFTSEKELIERLIKKYPESSQLEWNRDINNFNVLQRSDIMISDFSGVIFDFTLVYDKPVIYTNPTFDIGIYDAWWLNTPLWQVSALPRIGCELTNDNITHIKELIDTCLTDTQYTEGRHIVKAETWAYCGEGAKRTADYLINKYNELMNKEGGR